MRPFIVVVGDPVVQIDLQFFDAAIDFPAECNLIELLQDRLVEALADAVGLRVRIPVIVTADSGLS